MIFLRTAKMFVKQQGKQTEKNLKQLYVTFQKMDLLEKEMGSQVHGGLVREKWGNVSK